MRTPEPATARTALVFQYIVSSTEMRFIERAERQIYLGIGTDGGLCLWGEIPGCGEACRADLSGLLLEYAMSHEGAKEPRLWREASQTFADQAGRALGAAVVAGDPGRAAAERARHALERLLSSMESAAGSPPATAASPFGYAACPLCKAAWASGTVRVLDPAHDLFLDLCQATLRVAAPGWTVSCPDDLHRPEHPLLLILVPEADR
jgi:hypothetical protein